MPLRSEIDEQLSRLAITALEDAGLYPVWCPGVAVQKSRAVFTVSVPMRPVVIEIEPETWSLIDERASLASKPARDWPTELLLLLQLGAVYLRDDATNIEPSVQFDATRRLVIRRSYLGHYTVLSRGPIVITDSFIGTHNLVVGPAALIRSTLHVHSYVGKNVIITDSFVASYAKAQVNVTVNQSLLGAYAGLDGGSHPEQYPLSVDGSVPEGVSVGAHNWVGHHAALLAGTRTGEGVTVGSGVILTREVPEHVLLVGTPLRALPIDFHIRSLTPDEAWAAGNRQGPLAAMLPVYGRPVAGFSSPTVVQIEYVEHGFLRQLVGRTVLDFQSGALAALFRELYPDVACSISYSTDASIMFEVRFEKPVPPIRALTTDTALHLRIDVEEPIALSRDEANVYRFLRRGLFTYGELLRHANSSESGLESVPTYVVEDCVHRLASRDQFQYRFLRSNYQVGGRERSLLDGIANLSGASDRSSDSTADNRSKMIDQTRDRR